MWLNIATWLAITATVLFVVGLAFGLIEIEGWDDLDN